MKIHLIRAEHRSIPSIPQFLSFQLSPPPLRENPLSSASSAFHSASDRNPWRSAARHQGKQRRIFDSNFLRPPLRSSRDLSPFLLHAAFECSNLRIAEPPAYSWLEGERHKAGAFPLGRLTILGTASLDPVDAARKELGQPLDGQIQKRKETDRNTWQQQKQVRR